MTPSCGSPAFHGTWVGNAAFHLTFLIMAVYPMQLVPKMDGVSCFQTLAWRQSGGIVVEMRFTDVETRRTDIERRSTDHAYRVVTLSQRA